MIPSNVKQSGMPTGKKYMGWWGDFGGPKQKGIAQYAISPYRQSPMKNAIGHYITQGSRRIAQQVPYWIAPFVVAYGVIKWADSNNHYRNTKAGQKAGYFP
ncbi:ubiquinol-cytochrome c reductase subunit 8 [Phakopsora pachyrhizi]|uniref:Cytochrome b-c1 complex subunit 8 n=1 Tax=Phakopsora pachyrhizi TaxID=170000 RepID=A0AAV0BF31_PHAPC|nr:ubiquinol-cytochrome c reductase subunit 8 [Phakopsora pachyrhizi]